MRKAWFLVVAALVAMSSAAQAVETKELILNEFNCVRADRQLDDGDGSDSVFGTVDGNGGNWIELVVTEDVDSLVGYTLFWANAGGGTNHNGTITFVDPNLTGDWDNLTAGTIITIMEADTGLDQGPPGNTAFYRQSRYFDTYNGTSQKWLHAALDDDDHVTHVNGFIVDNDDWRMKIMTAATSGTLVQDWVGESITDFANNWGDSNINTYEVGKLQADADSFTIDDYDAGDHSTFGAPNTWGGGLLGQTFPW
jgi:hypothetical protein